VTEMIHGGNVWQGGGPGEWLDYSANIRPEGAPEWVRAALEGGMDNVSYYPDQNMRRAREALAEYLGIPAECALPTAGGISAIDMATHLDTTGMVLCAPCFAEYEIQSANRGKPVFSASLLKEKHIIGAPAEMLRGKLFEGCTVWLCNPMNPVGIAFSREQVLETLAEVEKVSGWLVVDEAFIEYCPQHSVVSMIDDGRRLLVTGSMTKILGIPGVRLGYLCAPPRVLEGLRRYQLTWEISCFAEAVLCALPQHRADISRDAACNAARRDELKAGLEKMGIFVYPSGAAFLLADFGRPVEPMIRELKKRGILVRQCMNFEGIDDGRHLRLAVKDEASNEKLLAAIREAFTCAENH
jgi:threonine-phosphate decarboxylase